MSILLRRNVDVEARKRLAEAFVSQSTAADAHMGRGDHNFTIPPKRAFSQGMLDGLMARGIAVYVGVGNVFLADLTGQALHVVQRRPLAQRTVRLTAEVIH